MWPLLPFPQRGWKKTWLIRIFRWWKQLNGDDPDNGRLEVISVLNWRQPRSTTPQWRRATMPIAPWKNGKDGCSCYGTILWPRNRGYLRAGLNITSLSSRCCRQWTQSDRQHRNRQGCSNPIGLVGQAVLSSKQLHGRQAKPDFRIP